MVNTSGITGAVNCSVASNDLVCTANGPLTINVSGSFDIALTATPRIGGAFVNPRIGGACQVDPNNGIAESIESNNSASDAVAVAAPIPTLSDAGLILLAALLAGAAVLLLSLRGRIGTA